MLHPDQFHDFVVDEGFVGWVDRYPTRLTDHGSRTDAPGPVGQPANQHIHPSFKFKTDQASAEDRVSRVQSIPHNYYQAHQPGVN